MKVSAQEEFGLRCLIAIASRGPGGTMTIPELSEHEGLSQPHVGKLMAILRKEGYVKSTRGQIGGYSLSAPPREIKINMVLEVLGGKLFGDGFCDRHRGTQHECNHQTGCSLRALWTKLQGAVDDVLNNMTLQDLLDGDQNASIPLELTSSRRTTISSS